MNYHSLAGYPIVRMLLLNSLSKFCQSGSVSKCSAVPMCSGKKGECNECTFKQTFIAFDHLEIIP